MAQLLAYADAVDIGYGRGRLAAEAAASLRRIDDQLGRPADVNEAWRSPEQADANYRRWIAYQNGTGPVAPYALPASQSIHCRGYAVDSDDWYNSWAAQVWRDNGWRQTARYPGTSKDEPWHGEYFPHLDKYYGRPSSGGAENFEPNKPAPKKRKRKNMSVGVIYDNSGDDKDRRGAIVNTESGFVSRFTWFGADYANAIAVGFGLEKAAPVSKGTYDRIVADAAALAARLNKPDAPKA